MLKISLALNMLCNATIVKTNMPLYGGPLRKNVIQILVLSTILSLFAACSEKKDAAFDIKAKLDAKGCFSDYEIGGIVGGAKITTADPLSKKVVMLLMTKGDDLKICTGTPIASDVILTAAHCTHGYATGEIAIVFHTGISCGSGFKSSTHSVGVRDIIVHEGYNKNELGSNDVSLIRIKSTIPSGYEVSELYTGDKAGDKVTLLGYGLTSDKSGDSGVLRKVFKSKSQTFVQSHVMAITQNDNKGICQGDSGGPVFFEVDGRMQVAGVNSLTYGGCHKASIAMYVPYFKDWIQTKKAALR